jgi:hypothetical protein
VTRKSIDFMLRDVRSWRNTTYSSRHAFLREMRGKQYGYGELLNAWGWFLAGWCASDQFHK